MVVFNPAKREIGAKIVYYGPALCGKTTNLQFVHKKLNPNQRGDLVSLATKDDRTLFFDFLPLDLGTIKGFKTRFHLYTVPGQVYYVSTRRAVLTGVDGVVFVADSQADKMAENIESLEDLERNLLYYGKKLDELPMVLQYNKRDMENVASLKELNEKLNKRNVPFCEASAVTGQGVMETLTIIAKAILTSLEDTSKRPKGAAPPPPPRAAAAAAPKAPPPPPKVAPTPPPPPKAEEPPLVELENEERFDELEKLRAERRASIKEALLAEEETEDLGEITEEPIALEEPPPARVASPVAGETVDIETIPEDLEAEEFEAELELQEEPLEFGEGEEEIGLEAEEEPLELTSLEKEAEREEVQEGEKPEEAPEGEPVVPSEPLVRMPEEAEVEEGVREERLPEAPAGVTGMELVGCGQVEKISPLGVRIPLIIRLLDGGAEAKITLTIELEKLLG